MTPRWLRETRKLRRLGWPAHELPLTDDDDGITLANQIEGGLQPPTGARWVTVLTSRSLHLLLVPA